MEFSDDLYCISNRLTRLLSKQADHYFQPLGLTSSYAFLLLLVNAEPGIQPTQLSKKLHLTPSTITRLIEKMEYQGYLQRKSAGRATHVEPTAKGEAIDEKLQMARQKLHHHHTEILGDRYTQVLTEMMAKASEQLA